MIREEIYINGQRMELADKGGVTLLFDSMLFRDLKSLVSNRSVGYSFPKTAANLRAIENAHLSDVTDGRSAATPLFPRRKHSVDYYRNGVPILQGALAMLDDITDTINFVFVFGNMENTQWLEKKLTEMGERETDFISWTQTDPLMAFGADKGLPYADFGCGTSPGNSLSNGVIRPTVSVNWILDRMAAENGLTIDRETHFDNLYIPLMTSNKSNMAIQNSYLQFIARGKDEGNNTFVCLHSNAFADSQDSRLFPSSDGYGFNGGRTRLYTETVNIYVHDSSLPSTQSQIIPPKLTVTLNCYGYSASRLPNPKGYYLEIVGYNSAGKTVIYSSLGSVEGYGTPTGSYLPVNLSFTLNAKGLDMSDYDSFRIQIRHVNCTKALLKTDSIQPRIRIRINGDETGFGKSFPVVPNLPDMKQVDFLKAMMQLRGLFAYPKDKRTIGMVSVDDVMAKKEQAPDWTDKLIADSVVPNAPENIKFAMSGFAQQNWCKWTNDDEITPAYASANGKIYTPSDDCIYVNNETLAEKSDALTLPFSASLNEEIGLGADKIKIAFMPFYSQDGDKVKENKIKSRVLTGKKAASTGSLAGRLALSYEELDFNHLINNYYTSYRQVVENPRLISAKCILSDLDQANLDLTCPVYFRQLGHYYIVQKVQAQANGICSCDLLELP